ncbi:hypothetical protein Tco_1396997 [Tanacetum coccineum]
MVAQKSSNEKRPHSLVPMEPMATSVRPLVFAMHHQPFKDWSQPFELMCDASDFTVGAVLGQREGTTHQFDIEFKNKKGAENVMANHLSPHENLNLEELRDEEINDDFPDETLMNIATNDNEENPWFTDFVNYFVGRILSKDEMIWRCAYGSETQQILDACYHDPIEGHYSPSTTTKKVFDAGFYWKTIFKEAHSHLKL